MAGPIASLFVALGLDARDYTAGLTQAGQDAQGFAGNMSKIGGQMASVGKTLTLGLTLPILGAAAGAIKLAQDAEDTDARLTAAFKSMGADAWTSLDTLQTKATDLMSKTTFDDEAVKDAQAVMLTFGNVTGGVFDAGIEAALNMSTALGTDLQGAVLQVGKALQDPVGGITALKRAGVSFTDKQKAVIQALVDTGDVAGAQAIIIGELKREFGGMAEAAAGTSSGQMKQAMNELAEAGEQIGILLLPVIRTAAGLMKDLAKWFQSLSPEVKTAIVQVAGLAAVLGPVLFIGGKLVGTLGSLVTVTGKFAGAAKLAATNSAQWSGAMAGAGVAAGAFAAGVMIANEAGNELEGQYGSATEKVKGLTSATDEQIASLERDGKTAIERADALKFMGFWDTEASVALRELGQASLDTAARLKESQDAANNAAGAFSAIPQAWKDVAAVGLEDAGVDFGRNVVQNVGDGVDRGLAELTVTPFTETRAFAGLIADARALGASIPGTIGKGLQDKANEVLDGAKILRDILKNGLTPEARAMQVIGAEFIDLIREGMDSKKDGAKETAQSVALAAINTIEEAGLTGAQGQKGLKAVGVYFGELLASGMSGQQALAALEEAGVTADSSILAGVRSQYPQLFESGNTAANKTIGGWKNGKWYAAGFDATSQIVSGVKAYSWYQGGWNTAKSWIGGFASKFDAYNWANLINSSIGPYTRGQSPPKKGPLHDVDKWGFNVGSAWVENFALAFGRVGSMLSGVQGPSLLGPPTMAGLGMTPAFAMAGGGGTTIIHVHGNVYGGAAGLRELGDDIDGARRQQVRGANRKAGR